LDWTVSRLDTRSDGAAVAVVCVASWNTDLVSHIARPLQRGETVLAQRFETLPGGKGSNAAIACARQGAKTAVIARIGDDGFGAMATGLWRTEGIDVSQVVVAPGERSGVAQILIYDDGDNSIAVSPGAGLGLNASHVGPAASTIRSARVVMASCEVPLEATQAAFQIARAAGVFTLLNPAPAMPLPDALLVLCDLVNPNETEARTLSGLPADAPLGDAAERLFRRGAGAVLITQGRAGCTLWRPGVAPLQVPGWVVTDVADTVGAGDTFTGALAAALARDEPLEQAVRRANASAALSVRGAGAVSGMPTFEQTRLFMEGAAAR
jgi:ribokinase